MLYDITSSVLTTAFELLVQMEKNDKTIYANKYYCEDSLGKLIAFLSNEGYPTESFDLCCPVAKYFASYAKKMSPDLTIMDAESLQPLAFFRAYRSESEYIDDELFDDAYHFNKHSQLLLYCPYYVVINDGEQLRFFNLRSLIGHNKNDLGTGISKPLGYEVLKNNASYRTLHNQIININKLQRYGKIACSIVIPLLALVLLVLDACEIYTLSSLRLMVCGIALLALLIPYLTQVTIKDVSVAFNSNKRKQ